MPPPPPLSISSLNALTSCFPTDNAPDPAAGLGDLGVASVDWLQLSLSDLVDSISSSSSTTSSLSGSADLPTSADVILLVHLSSY